MSIRISLLALCLFSISAVKGQTITFNSKQLKVCMSNEWLHLNVTSNPQPIGGWWSISLASKKTCLKADSLKPSCMGLGAYYFTYSFKKTNGDTIKDSLYMTVWPLPVVSAGNFHMICATDGQVDLSAVSGATPAGAGGKWYGTGVNSTTGTFNTGDSGLWRGMSGSNVIRYEFTDSNGCVASDTNNVYVLDPPPIYVKSDTFLCEKSGSLVLNSASPSGGVWDGTGVNHGQFDGNQPAGEYFASYTILGSNGCKNFDTMKITIMDVEFHIDQNWTGYKPYSVLFSSFNTHGNYGNYIWNFGDGGIASGTDSPTHVYTTTGLFAVSLTATSPAYNCSYTETKPGFILILSTGIDAVQANSFSLFPNPSAGDLHLRFDHDGSKRIRLTDMLGRELADISMSGIELDLELNRYRPDKGLVLVQVEQDGRVESLKVVYQ